MYDFLEGVLALILAPFILLATAVMLLLDKLGGDE